jgi:hypothetical protein
MLRHACGYKLANDGHDTRAIQAYLPFGNLFCIRCHVERSPSFWMLPYHLYPIPQREPLIRVARNRRTNEKPQPGRLGL